MPTSRTMQVPVHGSFGSGLLTILLAADFLHDGLWVLSMPELEAAAGSTFPRSPELEDAAGSTFLRSPELEDAAGSTFLRSSAGSSESEGASASSMALSK